MGLCVVGVISVTSAGMARKTFRIYAMPHEEAAELLLYRRTAEQKDGRSAAVAGERA